MTTPVRGGQTDNATKIAAELDEHFTNLYNQLTAWRARIASASATDSWDAHERYLDMVNLRVMVEQRIAGGQTGGVSAAYAQAYPTHQDGVWHGGEEWTLIRSALDPLITTLQDSWPKKAASGEPAYQAFDTTTGQLVSFQVPFGGAAKANLLAQIDAVLATFTPV